MTSKRFINPLASSMVLLTAVFAGGTPAYASTDADPQDVAAAVSEAAPTDLAALPAQQSQDQVISTFNEGGTASVGIDPLAGLSFTTDSGEQGATMTIPGADSLSNGVVAEDGSVTYAGNAHVPSVNVLTAEDAVRISTVITSGGQTENFDYDFGAGATVEIQEDGSAFVLRDGEATSAGTSEQIVADIDTPWATDAAGAAVETYYVADGSVLTQVVKHQGADVAYPVVADPSYDQPNIIQHRIRFNRAETATIATGGWGGVIGSFTCGIMAPVCALASGALAYNAGVAQNSNPKRCVQVTATSPGITPGIIWWVDTYAGGPCR